MIPIGPSSPESSSRRGHSSSFSYSSSSSSSSYQNQDSLFSLSPTNTESSFSSFEARLSSSSFNKGKGRERSSSVTSSASWSEAEGGIAEEDGEDEEEIVVRQDKGKGRVQHDDDSSDDSDLEGVEDLAATVVLQPSQHAAIASPPAYLTPNLPQELYQAAPTSSVTFPTADSPPRSIAELSPQNTIIPRSRASSTLIPGLNFNNSRRSRSPSEKSSASASSSKLSTFKTKLKAKLSVHKRRGSDALIPTDSDSAAIVQFPSKAQSSVSLSLIPPLPSAAAAFTIVQDSIPSPLGDIKSPIPTRPFSGTGEIRLGPSRLKDRSFSAPIPVTLSTTAISVITRSVSPPSVSCNYFDSTLPRELKLAVMKELLTMFEWDEELRKAWLNGRKKWTGFEEGRRELLRLSRVSKSWQSICLDGQLWMDLNLRSFASFLPASALVRLGNEAGHFAKSLNLRGYSALPSTTLHSLALATTGISSEIVLPLSSTFDTENLTRLTVLDLQGCRTFSANSIGHLLAKSPYLLQVNLKAIDITSSTLEILVTHCPEVESLDISRCRKVSARGFSTVFTKSTFPLKTLRASGLKDVDINFMKGLGRALPALEVLDLSRCEGLGNLELRAFVKWFEGQAKAKIPFSEKVRGSSTGASSSKFVRRETRLRHLNLSNCPSINDAGIGYLAYTCPELEFLELANYGHRMGTDGLEKLLKTTPKISKIDLECASHITDRILSVLTPEPWMFDGEAPGTKLDTLIVSGAELLSGAAMVSLVEGCKKLRVLEADSTRINDVVIKKFILSPHRMPSKSLTAVDVRSVTRSCVVELEAHTRPRSGFPGSPFSPFKYACAPTSGPEVHLPGRMELDASMPTLKTFWGWSLVDVVRKEREKREKEEEKLALMMTSPASAGSDSGARSRSRPFTRRSSTSDILSGYDYLDATPPNCMVM